MINNKEPLSMAEAAKYLKKEDSDLEVSKFIKKFAKITPKDAEKLREKLKALDLMKLGEMEVVKIIDLMPKNPEELNKLFVDVSLDEDETKTILETVKEFK